MGKLICNVYLLECVAKFTEFDQHWWVQWRKNELENEIKYIRIIEMKYLQKKKKKKKRLPAMEVCAPTARPSIRALAFCTRMALTEVFPKTRVKFIFFSLGTKKKKKREEL